VAAGGGVRICFYSIPRYRCSELQDVCEHMRGDTENLLGSCTCTSRAVILLSPPNPTSPNPFAPTPLDKEKLLSEFLSVLASSVTLIGRSVLAFSSARKQRHITWTRAFSSDTAAAPPGGRTVGRWEGGWEGGRETAEGAGGDGVSTRACM
jgi:hypothetical protein